MTGPERTARLARERLRPGPGLLLPPPQPTCTGIVHLGIGAFHRAHAAVYTEDAMLADGSDTWGICGVTQRSADVVAQLAPQDHLYGVLERDSERTALRVVGAVREVLFRGDAAATVLARIADPDVHVVSMTVTEKGYPRGPGGGLDLARVPADLAERPPTTAIGLLVHGLAARACTSTAPLTILSCDNLPGNGAVLRRLVMDFCAALPTAQGDPLAGWIETAVRFPSTVVDRIVPATTDADRRAAARLSGLHDAGLVVAEPYRQWVIEDGFAAARPAWERAGAVLTTDVTPYAALKLRLLNATHSLLAYAGALAGHETIAAAVADPLLAAAAEGLMTQDATPILDVPDGVDVAGYRRAVLDRFANSALRHRTTQVAMDGSQKLPARLLGTIADRLRTGEQPYWAAFAVAAWMVYVADGADRAGRPLPLQDPLADTLRAAAAGPPAGLVHRMLGISEIFDTELAESETLHALLVDHVERLTR